MLFGHFVKQLSELEAEISPGLREQAGELMGRPSQRLIATRNIVLEVMAEIKDAEKIAYEAGKNLSVFPQFRERLERLLSNEERRLQDLRTELCILQDSKTAGKRRWEYSVLSARMDMAERIAKTYLNVADWGDKRVIKDRLRALKSLRKLVDEEYFDVKFVRVVPASQVAEPHPAESAKIVPRAHNVLGIRRVLDSYEAWVGSDSMPRDVRSVLEEGRKSAVWRTPRSLGEVIPGQDFPVELYIFNLNPLHELNPTVRIESAYLEVDSPIRGTFIFPRGTPAVKLSVRARAKGAENGEWIDAGQDKKGSEYGLTSGLFLPGRLSAYVRMDPGLPETRHNLCLPILKNRHEKEPNQLSSA